MERLCDICREHPATIHLQQIMGNREVDLHICDSCALENGIARQDDKIEVSLGGLFAGLVDLDGTIQRKKNRNCPSCGLSLKDFRKSGKLGCPVCFEAFNRDIAQFFEDSGLHGTYQGRLPRKLELFKSLFEKRQELSADLEQAVSSEDYEKAAELRDRLRKLDEDAG